MPDSNEKTRQRLAAELAAAEAQKKRLAEAAAAEEARRLRTPAPTAGEEDEQKGKATAFYVTPSPKLQKKEDELQQIVEAYQQKTGQKPQETEKGPVFEFKSLEDAQAFFQDCAEKGLNFFVLQVDPTNGYQPMPSGHHMISIGSGKLYQGNFDALKTQLIADQANIPAAFKEALSTALAEVEVRLRHTKTTAFKESLSKPTESAVEKPHTPPTPRQR